MNSKKRNFFTILTVLILGIALGVVVFLIHESYALTPAPAPTADPDADPHANPNPDAHSDPDADTHAGAL